MKRTLVLVLAATMLLALFAACAPAAADPTPAATPAPGTSATPAAEATPTPDAAAATIRVVSMFGGSDPNRESFEAAVKKFETETGNKVQNESATVDDAWKSRVLSDFEVGSDPDVIQMFTSSDSDPLISAGKIVSVEDIKAVYPEYAANMSDAAMANVQLKSPVDGKVYGVPTNGYWEAVFYNKALIKEAGYDAFPTDWNEFLKMCDALVAKGITPIAESLAGEPNYTFEFLLYNKTGPADLFTTMPKAAGDDAYNKYVEVLKNFKMFQDKKYYNANAVTASRDEAVKLVADGKAAMLFGGHWNRGGLEDATATADIDLAGFPTEDAAVRAHNTFVGGYSSGFMISKKAWDDPAKQKACVDFIMYVTADEPVATYAGASASPLKNVPALKDATPLTERCMTVMGTSVGMGSAAEDGWNTVARANLWANVAKVCAGAMTPEEAVDQFLADMAA